MLLVDTCGAEGGVAIADLSPSRHQVGQHIVAARTLAGRETQERLMSALSEVLAEAALTPATLDVLAVVTGPGSFTGVRVGLAAIKGLAEALGKPVVALSRLAVLAAGARQQQGVQAWIVAGRGDVFVGTYRNGLCLGEHMLPGTDVVAAAMASGDTVIVMEEQLVSLYPAACRVTPVGVREALPLAYAAVAAAAFADPALIDANYLRIPDVELTRLAKQTHGGMVRPELSA